jgi:octanoyl-[GcvH]:protein N-octanoyltransferase
VLQRVGAGELPETIRLARPEPMVAFGKQDAVAPGYGQAVRSARESGFEPVLRLAGGRAAVFHEGTIGLAHAVPENQPRARIRARFEATAGVVRSALAALGVDARVGEVAGEYCPGTYSVNARGAAKLAGIGQRLIARAAHVGVVVVVSDAARVRGVLAPVYDALGLDWDPSATGEVAAEAPGAGWEQVRDALLAEYARDHELVSVGVDEQTLELALELVPEHRAG